MKYELRRMQNNNACHTERNRSVIIRTTKKLHLQHAAFLLYLVYIPLANGYNYLQIITNKKVVLTSSYLQV